MRATAITAVVLSHSSIFFDKYFSENTQFFASLGFFGVELFFVLSGFLIGTIILNIVYQFDSFRTLLHFWVRRWFRTLPNYFLFVLIHFFLFTAMGRKVDNIGFYFVFLQNFKEWGGGFFPVSWSLSIEEWFYIIFPFFLWFGFKIKSVSQSKILKRFLSTVIIYILLFLFVRIILVLVWEPNWGSGVRLALIMRLDAPIYGVLAAYIAYGYPEHWSKFRLFYFLAGTIIFFISGLLFVFYGNCFNSSLFFKTAFFSFVSISIAMWLPLLYSWKSKNTLLLKVITNISLWSYSIYLCHDPIRRIVYFSYLAMGNFKFIVTLSFFLIYTALAIYMARFVYLCFEKPVMDLRERFNIFI